MCEAGGNPPRGDVKAIPVQMTDGKCTTAFNGPHSYLHASATAGVLRSLAGICMIQAGHEWLLGRPHYLPGSGPRVLLAASWLVSTATLHPYQPTQRNHIYWGLMDSKLYCLLTL